MGKDVISKIYPTKVSKMKYTDAIDIFLNSFNFKSDKEFSLVDKYNMTRLGFIDTSNCSIEDGCMFLDLLKTCDYYLCVTEIIKCNEFENYVTQLVKTTLYEIEMDKNE